jgi:hypothetical protein
MITLSGGIYGRVRREDYSKNKMNTWTIFLLKRYAVNRFLLLKKM